MRQEKQSARYIFYVIKMIRTDCVTNLNIDSFRTSKVLSHSLSLSISFVLSFALCNSEIFLAFQSVTSLMGQRYKQLCPLLLLMTTGTLCLRIVKMLIQFHETNERCRKVKRDLLLTFDM